MVRLLLLLIPVLLVVFAPRLLHAAGGNQAVAEFRVRVTGQIRVSTFESRGGRRLRLRTAAPLFVRVEPGGATGSAQNDAAEYLLSGGQMWTLPRCSGEPGQFRLVTICSAD